MIAGKRILAKLSPKSYIHENFSPSEASQYYWKYRYPQPRLRKRIIGLRSYNWRHFGEWVVVETTRHSHVYKAVAEYSGDPEYPYGDFFNIPFPIFREWMDETLPIAENLAGSEAAMIPNWQEDAKREEYWRIVKPKKKPEPKRKNDWDDLFDI